MRSRRRLISESTSSGETSSQHNILANNVNVPGADPTENEPFIDCNLGAINYAPRDPITKLAILALIENQKQALGTTQIRKFTSEEQETPLRKKLRKSCTVIEEILLSWANTQHPRRFARNSTG